MGKKKRGSNWQNPGPSERTSQDQNFAQGVKTLFRIIQRIHHFAIVNNQLNGTVTKSFEAKLSDFNKFVKPACPTASLAQQIDLINSRWPQDITESLVAHFRERIDNFKRQLSTFRLDLSDCEKAQTLAEKWPRRNFRSKLKDCTLVEYRSICREWLSSNLNGRVTESSTPSSHLTNDSCCVHNASTVPWTSAGQFGRPRGVRGRPWYDLWRPRCVISHPMDVRGLPPGRPPSGRPRDTQFGIDWSLLPSGCPQGVRTAEVQPITARTHYGQEVGLPTVRPKPEVDVP